MKNKKKIIISIGLLLVITLAIGISYALWTFNIAQTDANRIASDCFKIEFTDSDAINLNSVYPITDAEGMELTPYTFTIKNVCSDLVSYQINIETLNIEGKVLPDKYIKVNLSEEENSKITTVLDKSTNSKLDTTTTIDNAHDAYKLITGKLRKEETKTFQLRVWMGENTPAIDEAMNASWSSKVSIIASYQVDQFKESGTLMATIVENNNTKGAFWDYKTNITKVVFEPSLSPKENATYTFDVSDLQDESVMSYLVPYESNNSMYTLYIQSKGGVKANENSSYLFSRFTNLESIEGMEYFDTSNVVDMTDMFSYNTKLQNLDLSNFDTSNVANMSSMFVSYRGSQPLDLSNFDTSNVGNMSDMFSNYSSSQPLDLSPLDTSNVANMSYMFSNYSSSQPLDLTSLDTSNVANMSYMFASYSSSQPLDLTSLNISSTTDVTYMFSRYSSSAPLDLSKLDTSKVTNMSYIFEYYSSSAPLDLSKLDISNVTNMSYMFRNYSSTQPLDVSPLDTSKVTNMSGMFSGCSSLTNIDVSNFDTSNVINISSMFSGCSSLTSLDVTNFDTSKVTNMGGMFSGCSSLTSLDVTNFDTSNVTYMSGMFQNCSSLTNIDVSNFDTGNVTVMGSMFLGCSGLTSLDLSNFTTPLLTNTMSMFSGCTNLKFLDISNLTFRNFNGSIYSANMFQNMPNSARVYVKNEKNQTLFLSNNLSPSSWTTANVIIKA